MTTTARSLLVAALLFALPSAALSDEAPTGFTSSTLPLDHIFLPNGPPERTLFLISDAKGWQDDDDAQAKQLSDSGNAVIGIDYPQYLKRLSQSTESCIYMVSDIEDLSHQIQRAANVDTYRPPIIAGSGAGGALALAMIAQSPQATIAQAIAVDPEASIALRKVLCTPAEKTKTNGGISYGLTDGPLPSKVTVGFTESASQDGRTHAESLKTKHPDIVLSDVDETSSEALTSLITSALEEDDSETGGLDLPLTELATKAKFDTLAIVYSGDGGWRDLDQQVAGALQNRGIPVVGVDSLRYFWSEKTPQQTASDLEQIVQTYKERWDVKNILLIGYSFGADILPAAYNLLSTDAQKSVRQISLLNLSRKVDYEIFVTGWLGAEGAGEGGDPVDDIAKIQPSLVQCYYGKEESETPCPSLAASGVETFAREGGHRFDGDIDGLSENIINGLIKRLGTQ